MNNTCIICKKEFLPNANNQKLCSKECRGIHGRLKEKNRYEKNRLSSRRSSICKICMKKFDYHFRSERGERIFCGRSCASKYHIQEGNFDSWRLRKNPTSGEMKKCLNPSCLNEVYLFPRHLKTNKGRLCSFQCEKQYFSWKHSGDANPFSGKSHSKISLEKQKSTLQNNYPGVTNAFSLAQKRIKTKPQLEIFDYVTEKFPQLNFQIEKRVIEGEKEYFADIVSFDKKLIVEFYGDYWHCNPLRYKEDFYHHVKKSTAKEIWEHDLKRLRTISESGYRILVIWETQYKKEPWKEILDQWLEENAKENNINVIGPSVNNYSSADVKLGELLGSHGTITTADSETKNAMVKKIELNDNQQPSSCEETLEKVQRLRSA